jgi:hypothetical protein
MGRDSGRVPTECVTAVLTSSVCWCRRRRWLTVARTHYLGLTGVQHASSALGARAPGPGARLSCVLHEMCGVVRGGSRARPPHGRSEGAHARREVECVHVSELVPKLRETPYLRVRQKYPLKRYNCRHFSSTSARFMINLRYEKSWD